MRSLSSPSKIILGVFLFALFFACSFFISSCGGTSEPEPDLVVWAGMPQEYNLLKEMAAKFSKENNKKVSIIKVPFVELKIKYQIAAPAGQGPDMIMGPQDWIGFLATAELIDNINKSEFNEEERKLYNPIGLKNMNYQGKLYGIPMALETIAIIANKKLMPSEPKTFDELIEQAVAFQNIPDNKRGFFYEANNMYFSWPILAGFGAKIFGETDGKIDINKILLNSPETIEGFKYLSSLKNKYNLIPEGASTDMMQGIFTSGNLMYALNGPWMLGAIKKQDIEYQVIPMPPLPNGKRPRPFVGVQGFMFNKMSKNKKLALRFAKFLNKPENQKKFCLASGRIPSRFDTLEQLQEHKGIINFAEATKYGIVMPNHPAIMAVWGPMNEALTLVIDHGKDPELVIPIQVKQIKTNIKTMID